MDGGVVWSGEWVGSRGRERIALVATAHGRPLELATQPPYVAEPTSSGCRGRVIRYLLCFRIATATPRRDAVWWVHITVFVNTLYTVHVGWQTVPKIGRCLSRHSEALILHDPQYN